MMGPDAREAVVRAKKERIKAGSSWVYPGHLLPGFGIDERAGSRPS